MRRMHEAIGAVETYSPAEERFNRRRRTAGLFLAPAVFAAVLAAPMHGLPPEGHRLAAVMATVVVLWVSEALPMAVTALLGPALAVLLQVATAKRALASFADPIIFLFIGSFMLAEAMFVHGLDRRIAFTTLSSRLVGSSATRMLVAYGAVATVISMWISNTATTAMLFPIGLSIVGHVGRRDTPPALIRRFAIGMMLITSFGASVGGMATPVGTPPNLIGMGLIERLAGRHVDFLTWMRLGVPIVLVLTALLLAWFAWWGARGIQVDEEGLALVRAERDQLGPWTPAQRNVLIAFGVSVALWVMPGLTAMVGLDHSAAMETLAASVPESLAALIGAILLFVLPTHWRKRQFTLTWDQAARIDWGIILLYGGGLALGDLAFTTGLAHWIGEGLTALLPARTELALTVLFTGAAIVLSEATSNTASANMIVPVAIAVAQAAGVAPLRPALGARLGASLGFMMPISTAPNAIVYSSGYVPIGVMMRHGLLLDVVGFGVIVVAVQVLGPLVGVCARGRLGVRGAAPPARASARRASSGATGRAPRPARSRRRRSLSALLAIASRGR
jgi:sodium-dependent dicarboxylate transporter 2/3/5